MFDVLVAVLGATSVSNRPPPLWAAGMPAVGDLSVPSAELLYPCAPLSGQFVAPALDRKPLAELPT